MSKMTRVIGGAVFATALLLSIASVASAQTTISSIYAPGCTSYFGYSSTTGASCGCPPGAVYNYQTGASCTASSLPSVTILSPNGDENYAIGDKMHILWKSSNVDKVNVGYIDSYGTLSWAAFGIPNTGSYDWTINVGNTVNTKFKIEVVGYQTNVGSATDYSDNYFVISANGCTNGAVYSSTTGQLCSNTTPTISGVSGPTSLPVGQLGLWFVKASNPTGGVLSYSVRWGDEYQNGYFTPAMSTPVQQTTMFTHVYSKAGIYTPTFTVTNSSGQSAKTSISVVVGTQLALPDLVANDLFVDANGIVNVKVCNIGATVASNNIWLGVVQTSGWQGSGGHYWGLGQTLAAGSCATQGTGSASFFGMSGSQSFPFSITVDPKNLIAESNENNNGFVKNLSLAPPSVGILTDILPLPDVMSSINAGAPPSPVIGVSAQALGGDMTIRRVDATFSIGWAGGNESDYLNKYVSDVSLYLNGVKLASLDPINGYKDGRTWTLRFSGLSGVIKNGQTGKLYVTLNYETPKSDF